MFVKQLIHTTAATTSSKNFIPDLVNSEAALSLVHQHYGYGQWKVIFPGDVRISSKVAEIFGVPYQAEPLPLESLVDLYHPDDRGTFLRLIAEALQAVRSFHYVLRIVTPDGEQKVIESIGDLRVVNGKVTEIFGLTREVTHETTRQALSLSRNLLLQDMLSLIPMPVLILDDNMVVIECSLHWLRCHGLIDRSDALGKRYYDLFPGAPEEERREFARALGGEIVKTKRVFINPSTTRKLDRHTLISRWMASDEVPGGLLVMVGWSEFGIAAAAKKILAVADFDGSLFDMLKQVG